MVDYRKGRRSQNVEDRREETRRDFLSPKPIPSYNHQSEKAPHYLDIIQEEINKMKDEEMQEALNSEPRYGWEHTPSGIGIKVKVPKKNISYGTSLQDQINSIRDHDEGKFDIKNYDIYRDLEKLDQSMRENEKKKKHMDGMGG